MIDIDTSILGAPPVRYDEFETSIRQEYSWVPEQLYRDKRAAVLSRFLSKTPIYSTPELRDEFEVRARDNLKRAIAALSPGQSTAV
jgi:predicted metal-dependent HD superfamily phosphohydrolase